MERKLYDAITRRSALLDEAKDLLDKGNMEGCKAKMADATAMNEEIEAMQALAAEQGCFDAGDKGMKELHDGLKAKRKRLLK